MKQNKTPVKKQDTAEKEAAPKKKRKVLPLFLSGLVLAPFAALGGLAAYESEQLNHMIIERSESDPLQYGHFKFSIGDVSMAKAYYETTGSFRLAVTNLCNSGRATLGKVYFTVGHIPLAHDSINFNWVPEDKPDAKPVLDFTGKRDGDKMVWDMNLTPLIETFAMNPSIRITSSPEQITASIKAEYINMETVLKGAGPKMVKDLLIEAQLNAKRLSDISISASASDYSVGNVIARDVAFQLSSDIQDEDMTEHVAELFTSQIQSGIWFAERSENRLSIKTGAIGSMERLVSSALSTCGGYVFDQKEAFNIKTDLRTVGQKGLMIDFESNTAIEGTPVLTKAGLSYSPVTNRYTGKINLAESLKFFASSEFNAGKLNLTQKRWLEKSRVFDKLDYDNSKVYEYKGSAVDLYEDTYPKSPSYAVELSDFVNQSIDLIAQATYLEPYKVPRMYAENKAFAGMKVTDKYNDGNTIRIDTDGTARIMIKALK